MAGRADERLRLGLRQEGIDAAVGRAATGERLGRVSIVRARMEEHALPRGWEEEGSASRSGVVASSALTNVEDAVLGESSRRRGAAPWVEEEEEGTKE